MKFLKKITGVFILLTLGLTSCKEEVEIKNSLSVSPDTALEFNATDNKEIMLTVITDAEEWNYTTPDWITAEKDGNTLIVNVVNNFGEARAGSINFTAGTAKQVKINVLQHEPNTDNDGEGIKITGTINDKSGGNNIKVILDKATNKATVTLRLTVDKILQNDAEVSIFVDEEYLNEYNYINKTSYVILPNNAISKTEWPIIIASETNEAEFSIEIDGTILNYSNKYLLPLKVKAKKGDVVFANTESRVNYVINKINPKEVKQMCIMEFGDANPLNVLEYKLEDGSYFFDALVLFSGNMGWDANSGTVRFNARTGQEIINANTATLIAEWETYIKPIHDAGIKVYMGIMPHHTQAGIETLSFKGCKWFAEDMAQIIKNCQMDGVFLDEEYLGNYGGEMSDEWAYPKAGGAYFAYQMSKQMDLVCDWPTEVAVYTYNGLGKGWDTITDHEDQSKHSPAEYADIMVADYGLTSKPLNGQTKKNCTGASLQLNTKRGSINESKARQIKEDGYGWIMYFAFNPDPNHKLCNKDYSINCFKEAARGCYDQELIEPTHYYKKKGKYDPTRYAY